ncbi:hypothetical protein SFRURICE_000369 [Spodoptera frugiperda]|nr:hypothetical protein SFRURICE_000369 [Spodoptera frugiperda]
MSYGSKRKNPSLFCFTFGNLSATEFKVVQLCRKEQWPFGLDSGYRENRSFGNVNIILLNMLVVWLVVACATAAHALRVGVGIADVTGPPAEIAFMGYAQLEQTGHGIHLRQFSRAFVLEEGSDKSAERLVFVSVDAAMMGHGVRKEVIKRLQKRYGDLYREDNVIISGTHTHSTPGGFLMDFLFDLPILGFVRETYAAYIVGIYKSIVIAHNKLTDARVLYGEAELLDANINRSPTSYLRNPPEERARGYRDHEGGSPRARSSHCTAIGLTPAIIPNIRFVSPENKILGVINWFAVHPTSMNNTNKLISSDNVGYASVLMEKALNGNTTLPGKGTIVCAFASTNLGDVSPNTKGPHCEFSGKPCDQEKLLCKRPKERCFASGPGRDMFDSTRIIATKLFHTAMSVLNEPGEDITGPLAIKHQYVKMPEQAVAPYDPVTETFNTSTTVYGCLPAMGYSFAAGTTDGPGAFDFKQGTTTSNPLWNAAKFPYEWQPKIVSCSVARIGGLLLAAVPGEFTTMSGRRLRNVIAKTAPEARKVVIAGLSNIYSDYIATPEEYQAQRYEAASTIYGPHTLDIYLNKYVELTEALIALISLVPPVLWDSAPWGHEFGDCLKQPFKQYSYGDVVMAQFVNTPGFRELQVMERVVAEIGMGDSSRNS